MTFLLMRFIYDNGYNFKYGHAKRCADCKTGKSNSLHKLSLAIDILLFKNGEYLQRTEDYEPLGIYWETIGGSWGGRFGDGNHFSLAHGGMK